MFKVSLLPESYRRHIEGRKKKDIISKVALMVLVCLFIVYGGIAIKGQILNSKLQKLQSKNNELHQQFPALQKYQTIFDNLKSAQSMIESISPKGTDAVAFFTAVSSVTPDYVKLTQIDLTDWFAEGVCTLACSVQDYSDVEDYKALFETEEMKKIVKSVQLNGITRSIDADNNRSVNFTLVLSINTSTKTVTEAPQIVSNQEAAATAAKPEATTTSGTTKAGSGNNETTTTAADTTAASDTANDTTKGAK